MAQEHTVKSYDEELNQLRSMISRMGGLAEAQLTGAIEALTERNAEKAQRIIAADRSLDILEQEIESQAIQMIALRSPMADDLREIVAAIKISSTLERIADYAKNVAKRSIVLNQSEHVKPAVLIPQMVELTKVMLKDALDAYIDRDAQKTIMVWESDKGVDELYNSLFRELLTYMMENPRLITPCTHILFIAKNIERIGDHVTNLAEIVYYQVKGETLDMNRPKSDDTSFAVVPPPANT
ncbi:phosphate signaling complex protein PhoU [Govanella unica]|uniref:Phosphate-specific transport system accessory protein PhoU n=1 Tax=Govanella unica TaxID=2975056 RepID=A0A9X3TYB4_9PROT|nr:phosphate signaling complex protein PhoU [Govania unica]MDA5193612.1 phosphate signaling complex protein PhoU [Govania unica]